MPAPIAKAIIIIVAVGVAAGLAAYESPEVRKWVDDSKRKIAMAINSLGEEVSPRVKKVKKHDRSMDEEKSNEAEERRRQARAEILERGRILEERKKRQSEGQVFNRRDSGVGSLTDENGTRTPDSTPEKKGVAATTAVDPTPASDNGMTRRHPDRTEARSPAALHQSVDSPIPLRQLDTTRPISQDFPASYEEELRRNWNLPFPSTAINQPSRGSSTHPSESLLELTPTSEFPDPDISVPDQTNSHLAASSSYFSVPASHSSQPPQQPSTAHSRTISPSAISPSPSTSSYYYAHPSAPHQPLSSLPRQDRTSSRPIPSPIALSSAASTADSSDLEHIRRSEVGSQHSNVVDSDSDENGDGIRTPEGSLWTDVGSEVSGDR